MYLSVCWVMVIGLTADHPAPSAATGGRSRPQWDRRLPPQFSLLSLQMLIAELR
jgi:hypothetical protein